MEGHCLTGQSPQWAVVPMEEEKEGESGRSVKLIPHMLIFPRIRMTGTVTSTRGMERDNFLRFSFFLGGGGTRSPLALSTVALVTVVGPKHLDLSRVLRTVQFAHSTVTLFSYDPRDCKVLPDAPKRGGRVCNKQFCPTLQSTHVHST